MKNTKRYLLAAMCAAAVLALSGCGSEKQKIFEQAGKDLEQGNYEYALAGYETSIENGVKPVHSYRGAGIANMRMGNYEAAVEDFTLALGEERLGKSIRKDLLCYRATTFLKAGQNEKAMADCQKLAELEQMDANTYFLTGKVALALDSYDEAMTNFDKAYAEESTYDMAIRIYETYAECDMEADGIRYLEATLVTEPKSEEDYYSRGQIYYYMESYANAQQELITAVNKGSTEALLLLGRVYLAQKDTSNARATYQQYVTTVGDSAKGYNGLAQCDMAEGSYDAALANIEKGKPSATTEELQDLLYNEMVAYEKKLDFATALTKAQEYQEMFPGDASVEKEIVFLQSRVQNQ